MSATSVLDLPLPNQQEAISLFVQLSPSSAHIAPAEPTVQPLHIVGRALLHSPPQGDFSYSRELKEEHRIVGSWHLELTLQQAIVCKAVLYVCAGEGREAVRNTGAFLDVQLWAADPLEGHTEALQYRQLAQALLQRLRWLMNCLPEAWRLPVEPYALRLMPTRFADAGSFKHGRLESELEELLDETECIPGVDLRVFNGSSSRYSA